MRLKEPIRRDRIFNILCAYLRLRDRRGMKHEEVPIKDLVFMYGFKNFSKTSELEEGLRQTYNWIYRERVKTGQTPSKERITNMINSFVC